MNYFGSSSNRRIFYNLQPSQTKEVTEFEVKEAELELQKAQGKHEYSKKKDLLEEFEEISKMALKKSQESANKIINDGKKEILLHVRDGQKKSNLLPENFTFNDAQCETKSHYSIE